MKDMTKKLDKGMKEGYERGFACKCAEHGVDPDDLLTGLMTGRCKDETIKCAQAFAPQPSPYAPRYDTAFGRKDTGHYGTANQNPNDYGMGSSWDSGIFRGGKNALKNVGVFGQNAMSQVASLWGGGKGHKSYYDLDDNSVQGATRWSDDANKYQGQVSAKNFARFSPERQMEIMRDRQAPGAGAMNDYYDEQDKSDDQVSKNWLSFV